MNASAHSRLLALIAHLVLDGLSTENSVLVYQIPSLGSHVPRDEDADDWAAEHHRFFGHELLPWESVFRSPDVHLGGPVAAAVTNVYERAGFRPPRGHEPDHLGVELMFLAWLWDRQDSTGAANFAADHLRPWLIPASCAGRDAGGFYAEVLDLALELIQAFAAPPAAEDLAVPAVLDDPSSGLKQVALWLATPAWAGIFWTRSALEEVSRATGVAQGFGRRAQVLENTLFAASDAGKLPQLTQSMQTVIDRWRGEISGPSADALVTRLDGTSALLDRLSSSAQAGS